MNINKALNHTYGVFIKTISPICSIVIWMEPNIYSKRSIEVWKDSQTIEKTLISVFQDLTWSTYFIIDDNLKGPKVASKSVKTWLYQCLKNFVQKNVQKFRIHTPIFTLPASSFLLYRFGRPFGCTFSRVLVKNC